MAEASHSDIVMGTDVEICDTFVCLRHAGDIFGEIDTLWSKEGDIFHVIIREYSTNHELTIRS